MVAVRHSEIIEKILAEQKMRHLSPIAVAIEGVIGSGKSHTAKSLADSFPGKVVLLSMDLFFCVPRADWSSRAEGDINLREWYDFEKVKKVLNKIKDKRNFTAHGLYNLSNGILDKEISIDASDCDLLILEGLLSADPALRNLIDIVIFTDVPNDVAIARAEKRDKVERNMDDQRWRLKKKILHDHYIEHAEKIKKEADIVYTNEEL